MVWKSKDNGLSESVAFAVAGGKWLELLVEFGLLIESLASSVSRTPLTSNMFAIIYPG